MNEINDARELLRRTRIEVAPATYFLLGISHSDWERLIQNPELSPRGSEPFMILRDQREVTMLVDSDDWQTMRHAVRDARVEGDFRLLTLDIELGWNVTGYFALVASILAEAGVPMGAFSGFSRDLLIIKQEFLASALKALGPHVDSLC
jgi:hypothetical protein